MGTWYHTYIRVPSPGEGLGVACTAIECAPWELAREKPVTCAESLKKDILNDILFGDTARCLFSREGWGGLSSRPDGPPNPVATGNLTRVRGCCSFYV